MNTARVSDHEFDINDFNKSQTAKIVNIRKKRLEREKQKKKAKATFVNVIKSLLLVFIFVAMLSMIIYRNSLVSEAKYDIFYMKTQIKALNTQIEELNADIEQKTELKAVEKIAIEELKMQYPTKEQIVYVQSGSKYALTEKVEAPQMLAKSDEGDKHSIEDIVAALFKANK